MDYSQLIKVTDSFTKVTDSFTKVNDSWTVDTASKAICKKLLNKIAASALQGESSLTLECKSGIAKAGAPVLEKLLNNADHTAHFSTKVSGDSIIVSWSKGGSDSESITDAGNKLLPILVGLITAVSALTGPKASAQTADLASKGIGTVIEYAQKAQVKTGDLQSPKALAGSDQTAAVSESLNYYKVKPGDTAESIAKKFMVSVGDLEIVNCKEGQSINDLIKPGKTLKIVPSSMILQFMFPGVADSQHVSDGLFSNKERTPFENAWNKFFDKYPSSDLNNLKKACKFIVSFEGNGGTSSLIAHFAGSQPPKENKAWFAWKEKSEKNFMNQMTGYFGLKSSDAKVLRELFYNVNKGKYSDKRAMTDFNRQVVARADEKY